MGLRDELLHIKQRIPQVIRTDATNVSRNIFLATHTPFRSLRYVPSGITQQNMKTIDEETFFQQHLLDKRDDHQLIIVQGDNGSGKSHFIRWLKERYVSKIAPAEEAVLFISRAQSTLRGALEQIIHSDLFEEADLNDQLKKLIQANEHLSKSNLNKRIITLFAIEASEDENNDDSLLSKRHKKNLYAFLVEPLVQEIFFQKGGPIDRIQMRLSAEFTNSRLDDVSPRFMAEDFIISTDKVTELQSQQVNRRTLKLAESLSEINGEAPELRKQVAVYLNQFLESVVQKFTNLRGSDLDEVFKQLRRDLKKKGKNLTLFIEDITSFTGIDRALVEVLVTEHRGTAFNEEFCRIYSVVGITNEYYNMEIPDNIKDRVTGRLLLDEAFLTNEQEIAELSARYLNALYLDEKTLLEWVESGGYDKNLPIYTGHVSEKWASFTFEDGREFNLFPFNQAALSKLYKGIEPQTPRMFLRLVLSNMITMYCEKMEYKEFPQGLKELSLQYKIPNWHAALSSQIVERQSPEHSDRLTAFLRLWGDQTVNRANMNGEETVGSLPKAAYEVFGLPFIPGDTDTGDGSGGKTVPILSPPKVKKTGVSVTNKPDEGTIEPTDTKEQKEFIKLVEELEAWKNQDKLYSYNILRKSAYDAIFDFIDWESKGVPGPLVSSYFSRVEQVEIEGQASSGRSITYLKIKRNTDSYNAFLALGAYHYLGNKSWDFPEATDYLPLLYNWLHQIEDEVIKAVTKPDILSEQQTWDYRKWNIAAVYYSHLIAGSLENPTQRYPETYQQLFAPPTDIIVDDHRSEAWRDFQKRLIQADPSHWLKNSYELFGHMDNRIQGSITKSTKVYFIDAVEIIREIRKLNKIKWDLDQLYLPDLNVKKDEKQFGSYFLLKLFQQLLPIALKEELKYVEETFTTFCSIVEAKPEMELEGQIKHLLKEMNQLLSFFKDHNINYSTDWFRILNSKGSRVQLFKAIKQIHEIQHTDSELKKVKYLVDHPVTHLNAYLTLFKNMDKLIEQRLNSYHLKKRYLDEEESKVKVSELISKTKTELNIVITNLEAIGGGG
ncbi:hypothetical protein CON84_00510 [Bacillus sp. AFS094228]|nr:hypothetical protein CON84_00510 [Bacillus sp. AFS094228]